MNFNPLFKSLKVYAIQVQSKDLKPSVYTDNSICLLNPVILIHTNSISDSIPLSVYTFEKLYQQIIERHHVQFTMDIEWKIKVPSFLRKSFRDEILSVRPTNLCLVYIWGTMEDINLSLKNNFVPNSTGKVEIFCSRLIEITDQSNWMNFISRRLWVNGKPQYQKKNIQNFLVKYGAWTP